MQASLAGQSHMLSTRFGQDNMLSTLFRLDQAGGAKFAVVVVKMLVMQAANADEQMLMYFNFIP